MKFKLIYYNAKIALTSHHKEFLVIYALHNESSQSETTSNLENIETTTKEPIFGKQYLQNRKILLTISLLRYNKLSI